MQRSEAQWQMVARVDPVGTFTTTAGATGPECQAALTAIPKRAQSSAARGDLQASPHLEVRWGLFFRWYGVSARRYRGSAYGARWVHEVNLQATGELVAGRPERLAQHDLVAGEVEDSRLRVDPGYAANAGERVGA
jgi:hypothetical protein